VGDTQRANSVENPRERQNSENRIISFNKIDNFDQTSRKIPVASTVKKLLKPR